MSLSQNDSGRALEYGIASAFSDLLPAPIQDSSEIRTAQRSFQVQTYEEQTNISLAAHEICMFIIAHDDRLSETDCTITVQPDQNGMYGDVRDVIVHNRLLREQIGISAKNRHYAVKHSRLSEQIDFGTDWMGVRCSPAYFHEVVPVFRELRSRQRRGERWQDITDKKQRFYLPILQAFETEMQLLFNSNPGVIARALVKYLLGMFDFYKVVKQNGDVSITSYNIDGTLRWGGRMPLPSQITHMGLKPDSETTLLMTFDRGWQLSFRIHNASTLVEPSLKFDINIVGMPAAIARHEIQYRG